MEPTAIIAAALAAGRSALTEAEGKNLLSACGINVPKSAVVPDASTVEATCADMHPPFACKVVSSEILHKSDAGGVALNLGDAAAVVHAIAAMSARPAIRGVRIEGWLIEEMIPAGREFVVGAYRDPRFGPMIMVGLGGIFVEILKDIAFGICPIDEADAHGMIDRLRAARLFDGARGEKAINRTALVDVMLRLGGENGVMMRYGEAITEVDLNPVIVNDAGACAADARFILSASPSGEPRDSAREAGPPFCDFTALFEPKCVAVLGASATGVTMANTFIRRMKAFDYGGALVAIHPTAKEIEGIPVYPDIASTPQPIDYAYIAVAANRIPAILAAADGRCRFAQVISSGFGEIEAGRKLEEELVASARQGGVRILGPNCLGAYAPRGGLTFPADAPKEAGTIGVISQSGGLSTDIIKRGQWRGLRFSGLVTIGNSADVTPDELLRHYYEDPHTKAIGLYLEDIKDGRAFFDLLRSASATKPVVILKGGRSSQGRLAAASHTGALADDDRAWQALQHQTASVLVSSVDAFIDSLLALQCFTLRPDRPTRSITLFGNGGGTSVLGADAFATAGLDVAPFGPEARSRLEALGLPPGTSVANPVDTPVRTLQERDGWVAGEIVDIIFDLADPHAIAMHLNLASFVGRDGVDPVANLFEVIEDIQDRRKGQAHFALALRCDGSAELDDAKRTYRQRARAANVPVFDEVDDLAAALSSVAHLERQLARRQAGLPTTA